MYRVVLPDGELTCAHYTHAEHGIEAFTDDETLVAFVPYANLIAIINTEVELADERSIM